MVEICVQRAKLATRPFNDRTQQITTLSNHCRSSIAMGVWDLIFFFFFFFGGGGGEYCVRFPRIPASPEHLPAPKIVFHSLPVSDKIFAKNIAPIFVGGGGGGGAECPLAPPPPHRMRLCLCHGTLEHRHYVKGINRT